MRHRPNRLICGIDATPFTMIMFVVVTVFLLTAAILTVGHHGVSIDPPKVHHPISMWRAEKNDALIVGVNREDKIFFRTDPVSIDQLPAKIQEGLSHGAERKVYIRADAHTKYGWVKEVIDAVHDAGIEKIGFLVDQRKSATTYQ